MSIPEEPKSAPGPEARPARRRRRGRGHGRAPQSESAVPAPPPTTPVEVAARRLGIERLHPEQRQAIEQVLGGRDVLMVLPTGFGKSACYQIPSMVLDRPVVVISPLLALLRDQFEKLATRDIPVVRLDGSVRGKARKEALARIAAGGSMLVMTTPETLGSEDLTQALSGGISLAAVDEAHCLSEWGHDFRPSYLRLGRRLRALGDPPVLALTATATPRVREAITQSLHMRDPIVVAASPHRSNLAFEVVACEGNQRPRALLRLVQRLRRPGIIYCATRREVDMVWALMRRFRVPAYRYHGGMTATERDDQQERYMRPRRRPVMIATSAFGLGIDKRDIRYILHYQSPASLEQYVQEAGRSGRDGRRSNCILLYDGADRAIHEALLARSRISVDQLYRLGRTLAAWAGEGREPSVKALSVSAELGPRITAALLTKLEEAGLVERDEDIVRILVPSDAIESETRGLAGQFETLRQQDSRRLDSIREYAMHDGCRAMYLRGYFGEDDGATCGLCDTCMGREGRPSTFFAPLQHPEPPPRRGKGKPGRRGARPQGQDEQKRGGRRRRGRKPQRDGAQRPVAPAADGAAPPKSADGGADRPAGRQGAERPAGDPGVPRKHRRRRRGQRGEGAPGQGGGGQGGTGQGGAGNAA